MRDFIYWHDPKCKSLLGHFEALWPMDQRLSHEKIFELCAEKDMEHDAGTALHVVVGTPKVMIHNGSGSSKSGLQLWRILKHKFDRSSAFNTSTVLEIVWGMPAAKNIHKVMTKMTTLDRAQQEYAKQAAASRDPKLLRMTSSGI